MILMSAIQAVNTVRGKKAKVSRPSQISITPGDITARITYIQM